MTWASIDDRFTNRPMWDAVPYESRWHYLALVARVCGDQRWDGTLPRSLALRASDVPDPDACLRDLAGAGAILDDGTTVVLLLVDEHVPPPGQRPDHLLPRKRANVRAYRQRQCDAGRHSRHCPAGCPARAADPDPGGDQQAGNRWVTGNPGAGRGGAGRETPLPREEQGNDRDPWAVTS